MDKEKIFAISEPLINSFGLNLWGVEVNSSARGPIITVFIDKEGGVSLEDCDKVSKELEGIFDVENIYDGRYVLEVSSPGLTRVLYKKTQYEKFIGERIKVKTKEKINSSQNFSGILKNVTEDGISLVTSEAQEVTISFTNIVKAKVFLS